MPNGELATFIGEHNDSGYPDGFVRLINHNGFIFEGGIKPNGKMDGFCVAHVGWGNIIDVGWY